MKEWLTAKEIAAEALPSIGATERAVQLMAEREGWAADEFRSRKRSGRGGGTEYHIGLLPVVARVAYHARNLVVGRPTMPAAANDTPVQVSSGALSGRAALERDARLAIVAQFQRFHSGAGLRQASAMQIFCDDYNLRRLHVETWITDVVRRLSKGSLKRWHRRSAPNARATPGRARKCSSIPACAVAAATLSPARDAPQCILS